LINFTLSKPPKEGSLFLDTLQARGIKHMVTNDGLSSDAQFIMSFAASTRANEFQGFWLDIPDVPDPTIDLRVYVPSCKDRCLGEVQLSCRETFHLSRCMLRNGRILSFISDILYMYVGGNSLNSAYLCSSGLKTVKNTTKQSQITIRTLWGHQRLAIGA
jgi:hypothetical protein